MKTPVIEIDYIAQLAKKHRLQLVSYTNAEQLIEEGQKLQEWQDAGFAGEMKYMNRPVELLTNPKKLLAETKSILCFAISYSYKKRQELKPGFAKIARYAWGQDYHLILKQRMSDLICEINQEYGSITHRYFSDAVPLLERAIAKNAGLGFVGKNCLLIRPGSGSMFFLAEILLAATVLGSKNSVTKTAKCGSCQKCQVTCPTNAFTKPYQLDARRCISYLTIEKRGTFNLWERQAIADWIFGCDICQEVCPFNHQALKLARSADLIEFEADNDTKTNIELNSILKMRSQAEFKSRFSLSPILRAGRVGLIRNAACVAANTQAEASLDHLWQAVENDTSHIVRTHSLWAISRIEIKTKGRLSQKTKKIVDSWGSSNSTELKLEANNILAEVI